MKASVPFQNSNQRIPRSLFPSTYRKKLNRSLVCVSQLQDYNEIVINRRQIVLLSGTLQGVTLLSQNAQAGIFEQGFKEGTLPQGYVDTTTKLVDKLQESIQVELDGAEEREVRRKADSAKDLVKEFVRKWRDDPRVRSDASYIGVSGALQELGQFYMKNGQRSRLSQQVADSVLRQLRQAETALSKQ
eukprot:TRINITY_DN27637_c0_g1_i5.p2 TRINITY_DN27637_c0_g1~~TRINITY_DN27637_c0_g1_i5.p2  ORF type:complete len:201 (-),score=8.40 TRINITY_DN27637_c0_g1_i5:206-769(-)